MTELTQDRLKELLEYNPGTGIFIRKKTVSSNGRLGMVAGYGHPSGYIFIKFDKKAYPAHRLAFLFMTGHFPCNEVDHKNNNKKDNSWSNLRECSRSQNQAHNPKQRNNTSGFKGVSWEKSANKWRTQITFNGKRIHLGLFIDKLEAAKTYNRKSIELFGEFAHLNKVA